MLHDITIGLFGTCSNSTWRNPFIKAYSQNNIAYFNPQVDNWTPDCSINEAEHLAKDEIILFPVLSESFGLGSLAETGYAILNAIKLESHRQFVILIDDDVDQKCYDENPEMAKISRNTRAIIQSHLNKLNYNNVYVVNSLDNMLNLSLELAKIEDLKQNLKSKYTNQGD